MLNLKHESCIWLQLKKHWERHDCNISPFVIVQVGCWRKKKTKPHVGQAPLPGSSPELLWFVWNCDTVTVCFDVESWGRAMETGHEGLSLERKGSEEGPKTQQRPTTQQHSLLSYWHIMWSVFRISILNLLSILPNDHSWCASPSTRQQDFKCGGWIFGWGPQIRFKHESWGCRMLSVFLLD